MLGSDEFRKILVVSHLGKTKRNRDGFLERTRDLGIDEVIEFPKILETLIKRESSHKKILKNLRNILDRIKQTDKIRKKAG